MKESSTARAHVHPLTPAAEPAEKLDRVIVRSPEPVRHVGVELCGHSRGQYEVVLPENEPQTFTNA